MDYALKFNPFQGFLILMMMYLNPTCLIAILHNKDPLRSAPLALLSTRPPWSGDSAFLVSFGGVADTTRRLDK